MELEHERGGGEDGERRGRREENEGEIVHGHILVDKNLLVPTGCDCVVVLLRRTRIKNDAIDVLAAMI